RRSNPEATKEELDCFVATLLAMTAIYGRGIACDDRSMPIRFAFALLMTALSQLASPARAQDDPLAGSRLYADVQRYAAFGIHRYGTEADRLTTDWIADEMRKAGLAVDFQSFTLGKQYFVDRASVAIGGETVDALPFWWIPEDKASFTLTAPLAADDGGA